LVFIVIIIILKSNKFKKVPILVPINQLLAAFLINCNSENRPDIPLKYMEFEYKIERCILRAHMFEVTCLPCGIRERFSEEDEAIEHAYNHERVLTHSTSSGYFVSVNEV
jgi:hypothetical protein